MRASFPSINTIILTITCLVLPGCLYGQCINGPCALEHSATLKASKPYGAHWIKGGMTKESRREDIAACGARGNESVNFLPDEIQASKLPGDPNDIQAEGRLTKKWAECMRAKGYTYLEYCDERCQYP